ncbi:MAG: sigma-70 family RNA polymerase sigma factor [Desulfamplus sp.]|nr:sigma-70 family RNA polymerase sigma factor [Desulfamplus sp.]
MKLDEKELLQGLRQADKRAFEVLVDTYQKRILAIACGITLDREESLEIVQDVFLSVYQNIDNFREESGLFTWMRKITINISLNWKRRWIRRFRWNHQTLEDKNFNENNDLLYRDKYQEKPQTPEAEYIEYESENIIMNKIGQLPEKIRTVLVLKVFEKMSYEDIAQTLGVNIGTVKSRLHYAKKFLTTLCHSPKIRRDEDEYKQR